MEVIHFSLSNDINIKDKLNLCLGFFDGVHLGHVQLINEAKKYPGKVGVLSFESSPKKNETNRYLTPLNDKLEIFKNLGCDYVLLLHVDQDLLDTSKDDFIKNCLAKLNINTLICGDDFTFGKGGLGTPKDLEKFFNVKSISLITIDEKKIASRDIKTMILNGEIEKANQALGREYMVINHAQKGFGKGRTLGFNTVNVPFGDEYLVPKYGVYLTNNLINGRWIYGLTNVGIHPTLNKLDTPIIEAHLINYDKYCEIKEPVKVKFIKFIRPEKRFDSVDDLQKQVLGDIAEIKKYLGVE